MPDTSIRAKELLMSLLHRDISNWEERYWNEQLANLTLEAVIRRITAGEEHQRFIRDRQLMSVPAGHFYSPIVDVDFIKARSDTIFGTKQLIAGIELNVDKQKEFARFIVESTTNLPFQDDKILGLRYFYDNNAYVYGDAVVYSAMLLKHRPARIIEIGSGYSSALALDVIDLMEGYSPEVELFDPYPALVESLLAEKPSPNVKIEGKFVQDVPLAKLLSLEAGDFYFMDTTHIVKTGSDVLYHFEEILPRLKSGVILHLHDIFYPFEYPKSWVLDDKLSWNEIYYFRAFMNNNLDYEILYFNNYMAQNHGHLLAGSAPCMKNGGASIWFRKK